MELTRLAGTLLDLLEDMGCDEVDINEVIGLMQKHIEAKRDIDFERAHELASKS